MNGWIRRFGATALVVLSLLLMGTGMATAQPEAAPQGGPAAAQTEQRAGGEANLVLPDLSSVDFMGISGRSLLRYRRASANPTPSRSPASRTPATPSRTSGARRSPALASNWSDGSFKYAARRGRSSSPPSRNRWACASISAGSSVASGASISGAVRPGATSSAGGVRPPSPTNLIAPASYTMCASRRGAELVPSSSVPT